MDQGLVFEMLRALGINYPADLRAIEQMPFEQGEKALEVLKERARKNFRQLAFELHPDRTGNDPAKTERFKVAAHVRERIDKLTLRRAPVAPPPQVVMVHVQHVVFRHPFTTMGVTSTAATTGTNYGPGGPWYAARMRPT